MLAAKVIIRTPTAVLVKNSCSNHSNSCGTSGTSGSSSSNTNSCRGGGKNDGSCGGGSTRRIIA